MKFSIRFLFAIVVAFSFSNCASTLATMNSNKWVSFEMRPSQIKENGDAFYKGKLSDGSRFEVFYDYKTFQDAGFYYQRLMQDFGWYENSSGNWPGSAWTVKRTSSGYMYVNPRRKVAIYFNPSSNKYTAFKIRFYQWNAK